jgi:hypothetical protein
MRNFFKGKSRKPSTTRSLVCGLLLGGVVSVVGLQVLPASAAPGSQVLRIPVEQAASGYPVPVTYDMDQVIKFEDDKISDVWDSNLRLFKPRFSKGGNLIVLQAVASPEDLKAAPELGRGLGTLTVELDSGQIVVFNLAYSPAPKNQILTVYRNASRGNNTVLPSILDEAASRNAPVTKPPSLRVSQDGFTSPLSFKGLEPPTLSPSSVQTPKKDDFQSGYWILEVGLADPEAWSLGPDSTAYKAFFEILKKGKATGAPFDTTLLLAQKLSGVSDNNLIWLVRTLAARTTERPQKQASVDLGQAIRIQPIVVLPQELQEDSIPVAKKLNVDAAPETLDVVGSPLRPGVLQVSDVDVSPEKLAEVGKSLRPGVLNLLAQMSTDIPVAIRVVPSITRKGH